MFARLAARHSCGGMVRISKPLYAAALIGLFLAGFFWGKARTSLVPCQFADSVVGKVIRVEKRAASTSQYRVQTDSHCTLLVTASRFPEYQRGDMVIIKGTVKPLTDLSKDLAGYADHLARQGMNGTVQFAAIELQRSGSPGPSDRFSEGLRRRIEQIFPEPDAAVVVAMTLGDYGMIPPEVADQFRRTGLTHILAISGFNISIIAGLLWAVVQLLPVGRLVRLGLLITAIWGYVGLIYFPVSAVRAALFWTILLTAFEMRALVSVSTVYILAAAGMISFDPSVLHDVGFQLSFAAVAGIAWIFFLLRRRGQQRAVLMTALLTTLGATAATWPIISYHFGLLSLVTVMANMLVVPVVPAFFVIALAAIALANITPSIALIASLPVHILWQWIEMVVTISSRLPGTFDYTIPGWAVVVWYSAVIAFSVWVIAYQQRSWREVWE